MKKCGRVERFNDEHLVVALPELELVTKTSADLGARSRVIDRNAALGLALVELTGVEEAIGKLRADSNIDRELDRFPCDRKRDHPNTTDNDYFELDHLVKGIHLFTEDAFWEGYSFAAAVVNGAIAARIVPRHRSARQALDELLQRDPDEPGCGIRPNKTGSYCHA